MGSSGWVLPLTKLAGRKQATNAGVRRAIVELLYRLWGDELYWPWSEPARGWIEHGESSLLTVQDRDADRDVPDELTFWFYGSVSWADTLARHWLERVLAWRRPEVEHALGKLGFAIVPEKWPTTLGIVTGKDPRFFVHDERIGYVSGNQVCWELAAANAGAPDPTPLDQLTAEARAQLAVLDTRCLCPMCERHQLSMYPELALDEGHRAERIAIADGYDDVLAPRAGGLIACGRVNLWSWTHRSDRTAQAWTTIAPLTSEKRRVDVIHEVGDAIVAVLGYSSPKPPRAACESRDGGVTWSEPKPTGLPELKYPMFHVSPHDPAVVFVNASGKSTLYRSNDGGRTFGRPIEPVVDGQPVYRIWELLAFGERRLVCGYTRARKGGDGIAISDDGGKHFTTVPLGDVHIAALWGSSSGTIAVFAYAGEVPILLRSCDQGTTWTVSGRPTKLDRVALGGRWFVVEEDVGIHVSDDEGATWARIATGSFRGVFADGADPSSVYAVAGGVVIRIVVGALDARPLPAPALEIPPFRAVPAPIAAKRVTRPAAAARKPPAKKPPAKKPTKKPTKKPASKPKPRR